MAIGLEQFIVDIANSPTVNAVFNHPVYTALIVVSVVLLLIYFTMRHDVVLDEDSDTSMLCLMFTAGIYSILAVLGIVYLQHRAMYREFDRRYARRGNDEAVQATLMAGAGESTPIDVFEPTPVFHNSLEGSEEEEYYAEESVQESTSLSQSSEGKRRRRHRKNKSRSSE